MKKIVLKIGSIFTAVVMFAGTMSASGACLGPYYQPKVPEKMKKRF